MCLPVILEREVSLLIQTSCDSADIKQQSFSRDQDGTSVVIWEDQGKAMMKTPGGLNLSLLFMELNTVCLAPGVSPN